MLGLGYGLSAVAARSGWSPSALYRPADAGFWAGGFDPAAGRLFQDSAGTVPATAAGQPVGRAHNRAWGPAALGYSFGAAWSEGAGGVLQRTAGAWSPVAPAAGSYGWVEVEFDLLSASAGSIRIFRRNAAGSANEQLHAFSVPGRYNVRVPVVMVSAGGNGAWLDGDTFTGSLANLRFTALRGPVATQATAAARPMLMQAPGIWNLHGDGVDDALPITLPAGSWTRAYVAATGAVTIEDGLPLGGSEDVLRVADLADALYINRTLNAAEKAALAAYWGAPG